MALAVMFWIAWCYFGLSIVQISDAQRRAVVNYSYTTSKPIPSPTTALPSRSTTSATEETTSNSISKFPTTEGVLRGSSIDESASAAPPPHGPPRNREVPRSGSEEKASILTAPSEEDRVHARRVFAPGVENRPVEKYESVDRHRNTPDSVPVPRLDISPSKAYDADIKSGSSRVDEPPDRPPRDEAKTSTRDNADREKSELPRRDDIQSSRRSEPETAYREPDFDLEPPRRSATSPGGGRSRYDDLDDDDRGSRGRYDKRDRGRDSDDRLSKRDTRVYPDDGDLPAKSPSSDDRYRGRESYPEDSPKRGDDDRYDDRDRDYDERRKTRDRDTRYRDRDLDDRYRDDDRYRSRDDDRYRDRADERYRSRNDDKYKLRDDDRVGSRDDDEDRDGDRVRDDRYYDQDSRIRSTRIQDSRSPTSASDNDRYRTMLPDERVEDPKTSERREEAVLDSRSYASEMDDDKYRMRLPGFRSTPNGEYRRGGSKTDEVYDDRDRRPVDETGRRYRDDESQSRRDPIDDEDYRRSRTRDDYDRDRCRCRIDRYDDEPRRQDDRYPSKGDKSPSLPGRKNPDEDERSRRRNPETNTMRKEDSRDREENLRPSSSSRDEERLYSRDGYPDAKLSSRRRYDDDDDLLLPGNRDFSDDSSDDRRYSRGSRQPTNSKEPALVPSRTSIQSREPSDIVIRENRFQSSGINQQSSRVYGDDDGRDREQVRPLSAKDVIEAAIRHSDGSDQNSRKVYYPVFDPRVSNLTSPEIIRPGERRGTTITARKRRRSARFK